MIGLVVCRTSCKTPAANLIFSKGGAIRSQNCTAISCCGGSSGAVSCTGRFIGRGGSSIYTGIGCCIGGSIYSRIYRRALCIHGPEAEKRGKEKTLEKKVGCPHRY